MISKSFENEMDFWFLAVSKLIRFDFKKVLILFQNGLSLFSKWRRKDLKLIQFLLEKYFKGFQKRAEGVWKSHRKEFLGLRKIFSPAFAIKSTATGSQLPPVGEFVCWSITFATQNKTRHTSQISALFGFRSKYTKKPVKKTGTKNEGQALGFNSF